MPQRGITEADEQISHQIVVLRGRKVLLDSDLARLYGATTKRLNEQVRRNHRRFPPDFLLRLTNQEVTNLRSQFATSSFKRHGGRRSTPFAFTEHGALMAANVLNSRHAVEVSIFVVRAFVRLRETLAAHKELAAKLDLLEKRTESLALRHDRLATETRRQFGEVIDALRQLMSPPATRPRPIGFVLPKDQTPTSE